MAWKTPPIFRYHKKAAGKRITGMATARATIMAAFMVVSSLFYFHYQLNATGAAAASAGLPIFTIQKYLTFSLICCDFLLNSDRRG
jgi:hypothetical protein